MVKDNINKQARAPKGEVTNALDDILDKYEKLSAKDIEKFAPIYYPIAIIEMNLEEMTFEDFETVQYSILSIFYIGITDCSVIAETLGLSYNYVCKIAKLLNGYGLLNNNIITQLGVDSIKLKKKIIKSQVRQEFQMDALNGTLLKIEQTINENVMNDREQTKMTIGHLNYLDGMSVEDISLQLTKNDCNKYIKQKSSIMNTNVVAINDVRCKQVKYAKCYLMKLRVSEEPIVFAKRYNSKKKEMKDRFFWEPFAIRNDALREKYGFEKDIPVSTSTSKRYTAQLFRMMVDNAQKVNLVEEIDRTMDCVYPFDERGVTLARMNGNFASIVYVDEHAFMKYRSWIINFLIGIHKDGKYLITYERLYGNLISLKTKSQLILDVAELLDKKIAKYGKPEIVKRMKNKYKDYEGTENLITIIEKELNSIV